MTASLAFVQCAIGIGYFGCFAIGFFGQFYLKTFRSQNHIYFMFEITKKSNSHTLTSSLRSSSSTSKSSSDKSSSLLFTSSSSSMLKLSSSLSDDNSESSNSCRKFSPSSDSSSESSGRVRLLEFSFLLVCTSSCKQKKSYASVPKRFKNSDTKKIQTYSTFATGIFDDNLHRFLIVWTTRTNGTHNIG